MCTKMIRLHLIIRFSEHSEWLHIKIDGVTGQLRI